MPVTEQIHNQNQTIERPQSNPVVSFYKFHAYIYDATRWAFLFGRDRLLQILSIQEHDTILEVGCGTGRNLLRLAKQYPQIRLIGVDFSKDMLKRAGFKTRFYDRRVFLFERAYAPGSFEVKNKVNWIVCSYSLSMFNPGWEAAIERAENDLAPGGQFALVDFHRSKFHLFTWWMKQNHVRMDGHLIQKLEQTFDTVTKEIKPALFGLWHYAIYVGKKKA
ncbi:MAG: class I SAM-dependent methyltransferase [Saprospiraceae bacterium]